MIKKMGGGKTGGDGTGNGGDRKERGYGKEGRDERGRRERGRGGRTAEREGRGERGGDISPPRSFLKGGAYGQRVNTRSVHLSISALLRRNSHLAFAAARRRALGRLGIGPTKSDRLFSTCRHGRLSISASDAVARCQDCR